MSTFTNLLPLLEHCTSLTLLLTKEKDRITVVTIPKPLTDAPPGLCSQLTLEGAAAELDAAFCDAIIDYTEELKSVATQMQEQKAERQKDKERLANEAANKKVSRSAKAPLLNPRIEDDEESDTDMAVPEAATTTDTPAASSTEIELF